MPRIRDQQHPAGKGQHLFHLPHQSMGIQHGLTLDNTIVGTAVNEHTPRPGIIGDIDDLCSHHPSLYRLRGLLQLSQSAVFACQTRKQLQFALGKQQLLAQLRVLLDQIALRHKYIVNPERHPRRDIRKPIDRGSQVSNREAHTIQIIVPVICVHKGKCQCQKGHQPVFMRHPFDE